ncbi:hypothetical protein PPL_06228 [Heterostelium album PN500]|uniref:Uncharacterized protein n=1 Tax=Heterostelium pallidum (strain ATCC 26659 / Pp 5 / PN500) TaxID=670386 RepID=D3BCK3_HETP5|nr:hypothetical protein PPL_06228 [Heterostelium album PN500]EFA80645.1 hypothetical protein PPL_06228 [Heterostelium album PN500]|eukprot:XP_020432765.1 hypothetical protein PPL_06228 [Heterostelium album PN500]
MTLIKSISLLGNSLSGLENNSTYDIGGTYGKSTINSENQVQCWGRRRRTTNVIFGDVNVFGGGCGSCCGFGGGCGGFGF